MAGMFKRRSDMHLARKAWHIIGVLLMVLIHRQVTRELAVRWLLVAVGLFVIPDILRQFYPRLNEVFVKIFKSVIRENELQRLSGNSYLITGVLCIVLIFPPQIVGLTLLFLAFADPIASGIGILYGKDKLIGQKSLQGFLAALAVCTLSTYGYLLSQGFLLEHRFAISLLGGLIGALSELLPVGGIDDNFTLPIISATGLYVLFILFGYSF